MMNADTQQLVVNEYQLEFDAPLEVRSYILRRLWRSDGSSMWGIYVNEMYVLNRNGKWEREPSASYRDDEYLARCRYDSVDEALQHWHAWLAQRPAQGDT